MVRDDTMPATEAEQILDEIAAGEVPLTPKQAGAHPLMRCDQSTIFRLFQRGLKGVRLGHIQFGNKKMTTAPAIRRFLIRLNDLAAAIPLERGIRSPRRRRHDLAAARKKLCALGASGR